ncbi:MAG: LysR family transcriptional regulator [Helicobacteraceae bacterium]|nr:LysR family transcriptional regulator [Helicobacteraceae bacterium]
MEIYGRFWIKKESKNYLGIGRIELLKGIKQTGSISQAAKAMHMSYKAAWDNIDAINNLSSKKLVKKIIGGHSGGGTILTDEGNIAIEAFDELEMAKRAFCDYFNGTNNLQDLKTKALKLQEIINQK